MTCKQILDSEEHNLDRIVLYSEGIFWKAYEHSAFILCSQQVQLKPTKKSLKYLGGQSIISVGFPQSGEDKYIAGLEILSRNENEMVLQSREAMEIGEFEEWKAAFQVIDRKDKKVENTVEAKVESTPEDGKEKTVCMRIRAFSLATSTPLECMTFLSDMQNLLMRD